MKHSLLIGIAVLALGLSSCAPDSSAWYPAGSAAVESYYEYDAGVGRSCVVTLKITNSGLSKIRLSTISLSVATGARTYRKTVVDSTGVLAGKSVYLTTSLSYADATETTSAAGIAILDQFYE